ncbi:MAG: hypothetical protein JST12_13120 [Armatimonadetes bacterium]|nr:hypothetical protein [Armatimonadota bacterium]
MPTQPPIPTTPIHVLVRGFHEPESPFAVRQPLAETGAVSQIADEEIIALAQLIYLMHEAWNEQ